MVVDDNQDAADTLAALLLLCGADVRVCYNGAAAVRTAADFQPDVGLFDINMPWMGGCELAQRVRADAGRRPILLVAITGISDPGAVRRTVGAGFNIHLTKPADPAGLVATLADFDWWLRARSGTPGC
jgi:CheY-like chemotaxis protein